MSSQAFLPPTLLPSTSAPRTSLTHANPVRPARASRRRQPARMSQPPAARSETTETASSTIVTDAMVEAAHAAADAARPIINRYFRRAPSDLGLSFKQDETPVTLADREVESAIRGVLSAAFPTHNIIGEEASAGHAAHPTESEYTWVIDPIDGTKAFLSGRPTFGTLIALAHHGTPVLGLIDQPVSRERWEGGAGRQTTLNGAPVRVSAERGRSLQECTLHATTPDMFIGLDGVAFRRLRGHVKGVGYGSDCYAYALLASGCGELVVEADLKVWDFMALVPVVENAGGVMTDWRGRSLHLGSDGRVVAAASPDVLVDAVGVLAGVDEAEIASMLPGVSKISQPFPAVANGVAGNGNGLPPDPGPGHVESMTGYGAAIVREGNVVVGAQIKSVNSRYCDVQLRSPKYLMPFDSELTALVKQEAVRGKIAVSLDISVEAEDMSALGKQLPVIVDRDAAKAVRHLLDDVAEAAGVSSTPMLADILNFSEVLVRREPGGIAEQVLSVAKNSVSAALKDLRAARRREGAILEFDLMKRTRKLRGLLLEVEARAPRRVEREKKRLQSLTKNILEGKIDPMRMESEITLYADRADITEEIVRLRAHVTLFDMTFLGADDPIGQRLAFLLQEMNREAATIGAKAMDAPIAHLAVLMKEEIEKIREQCQNIR